MQFIKELPLAFLMVQISLYSKIVNPVRTRLLSVDAEADFYLYLKKAGFDTSKLENEYAKNQSAVADVYYYHGDHIGSSIYITNSAAETTQFFLNLPFGETMAEQMTGVYDNPFKFNAKELDSETGLYYYGARYYIFTVAIQKGQDLG